MNSLAIMQPYFFPYLGYFQLIHEVDEFVFYDDVNFIKSGWINRNKILINGDAKLLTIPCSNASQNKLILEVEVSLTTRDIKKLLTKVRFAYGRAPYFEDVFPIIEETLNISTSLISDIAIQSVINVTRYLGMECEFSLSSENFDNRQLGAADRLIDICKQKNMYHYVNSLGGKNLYSKKYFRARGIKLNFLDPILEPYSQFDNEFIPGLSIIDVLMFNSKEKVNEVLLKKYKFA